MGWGEMRDEETSRGVREATETGHPVGSGKRGVWTTLHGVGSKKVFGWGVDDGPLI